MFCKKGVLRNFTKFTGKHLWQSLFFKKVESEACNFIKKGLWHGCFPLNFAKFLRTLFLTEHNRWLFLANVNNVSLKTSKLVFLKLSFSKHAAIRTCVNIYNRFNRFKRIKCHKVMSTWCDLSQLKNKTTSCVNTNQIIYILKTKSSWT